MQRSGRTGYTGKREGIRDEQRTGAAGSPADGLEAWLEVRERLIRALEAENQELRRQLDALRHGAGISVVIEGHAFALAAPTATGPIPAHAHSQPHAPAAPDRSGYAFERSWPSSGAIPSHASHGSAPVGAAPRPDARPPVQSGGVSGGRPLAPMPEPGPSLPSMPTALFPSAVLPAPSHRALPAGAVGAVEDAWLTDQHPVPPARARTQPHETPGQHPATAPAAPAGPRPRPVSRSAADEAAWLRSGAAWPDTTPRQPMPPAAPAFPPPAPPASAPPQRPIRAPRTNRQGLAPAERNERNVFADSFIL